VVIFCCTAVRKVPTFSTERATISPDSPVVLTLKVLYLHPGLSLQEQGDLGRAEFGLWLRRSRLSERLMNM
jgi:hypothetical protein